MKNLIILALLGISSMASASSLTCHWINTGFEKGYYRPAQFDLNVENGQINIANDSYFERKYVPCWGGQFDSCYFSFELPTTIELSKKSTSADLYAEFTSLDGYGFGSLSFKFEKNIEHLKKDQKVKLTLDGDDGDGVYIIGEKFNCIKN
ncbi:MAG: hypothetical protein ACXVLQ_00340 [Bacteriovorax sp.]